MIRPLMVWVLIPTNVLLAACVPPDQNSTRAEHAVSQETEPSCAADGGVLLDHDGTDRCAFLITPDGVTAGMCEHGDGTVVSHRGAQYCVPVIRDAEGN